MSDFPNAVPPPSALFDNAPTVTEPYPAYTLTTTTGHLTPATRISQIRGGRWVPVEVFMQYGQPIPLELALRRVEHGRTVFVAREDKDAVMEAVCK